MTHTPGRCFWLWNRTLDVFAPGTGTRRITATMDKIVKERDDSQALNSQLVKDVRFLRRELYRLTGENNFLIAQDEWNDDIAARIHESPFASSLLPHSRGTESATRFTIVN